MRISEARWYDATLAELNGADVKFAFEGEDPPAAKLPKMTEEEIIQAARENMPPDKFVIWHKARLENNNKKAS